MRDKERGGRREDEESSVVGGNGGEAMVRRRLSVAMLTVGPRVEVRCRCSALQWAISGSL